MNGNIGRAQIQQLTWSQVAVEAEEEENHEVVTTLSNREAAQSR
jgi:hypothetical protein